MPRKRSADLVEAVVPGLVQKTPPKKRDTLVKKYGLSLTEATFCEAYLQNRGNGTLAAKVAGCRATTYGSLGVAASRMLRTDRVMAYLDARGQQLLEQMEITTELLAAESAKIAFSNIKDFTEWDERGNMTFVASAEVSHVASAAIKSITRHETQHGESFKIELHDKNQAIRFLGDLKGLVATKFKVDHTSGGHSLMDLANSYGMEKKAE